MDFEGMDTTLRALLFGGLFLVALAATVWTVYDAQSRPEEDRSGWAVLWVVIAGIGALLVLPALVINAFNLDVEDQDLIDPLSYVGIAGIVVTALGAIGYFLTSREEYEDGGTIPMPEPVIEETKPLPDEPAPGPGHTRPIKPDRPERYAFVRVVKGRDRPYELGEYTTIGRTAQGNDIVLDDDSVSDQHARIKFDPEKKQFFLHDLASRNGSWVITLNGKRQVEAPHPLSDGDTIELGETRLVFKEFDETTEA